MGTFLSSPLSQDIEHAITQDDYHIQIVAGAIFFTIFQKYKDMLSVRGICKE